MKLYEFFGNFENDPNEPNKQQEVGINKEDEHALCDQVFWYILDCDELHKKYFMPIAKKIKQNNTDDIKNNDRDCKVWLKMVNKGCINFYKNQKMKGDPKQVFHKKFRIDLAKKLDDHYYKDIIKDIYNLG